MEHARLWYHLKFTSNWCKLSAISRSCRRVQIFSPLMLRGWFLKGRFAVVQPSIISACCKLKGAVCKKNKRICKTCKEASLHDSKQIAWSEIRGTTDFLPSVNALKQAHRSWSPLIEAEGYFFFSLHPLLRLWLDNCEPALPLGNGAHATTGFHSLHLNV